MPGALQQIGCRRDSRERMEVVDEVRLVVVPAIERQIDPVDLIGAVGNPHNSLEAAYAAEDLGGEATCSPNS